MPLGLINKADIYGISTQEIFGMNEAGTTIEQASGNVGFDESPSHAPVKTVLGAIAILVVLRVLFDYF